MEAALAFVIDLSAILHSSNHIVNLQMIRHFINNELCDLHCLERKRKGIQTRMFRVHHRFETKYVHKFIGITCMQ